MDGRETAPEEVAVVFHSYHPRRYRQVITLSRGDAETSEERRSAYWLSVFERALADDALLRRVEQ